MVFSVSCPECHAEFPVDSAKVPEAGVRARCSECDGVFFVQTPVDQETSAAAEESTQVQNQAPEQPEVQQHAAAEDDGDAGITEAEPAIEGVVVHEPAPAEPEAHQTASASEAPVASVAAFGAADPDARAARLARVLVSDMMTYNPKLYEKAREQGTLAEDFQDEVKKSWSEYVDQVGDDLARSTPHFKDALNDILAQGDTVFQEDMFE